jgi:hypothetical protein
MVSADSEESQRDWFYCLKKAAAAAKWYKDTTHDLADKVHHHIPPPRQSPQVGPFPGIHRHHFLLSRL